MKQAVGTTALIVGGFGLIASAMTITLLLNGEENGSTALLVFMRPLFTFALGYGVHLFLG